MTAAPARARARGAVALSAVLDQGLFAASGFLVNVLLARTLAPADYGAFTIAFVVFLLLGSVHTALLTEPMLVHGAARYRTALHGYVRTLAVAHLALTAALAAGVGVAAGVAHVAGADGLAGALAGMAVALPALLLLWLARRAFYVDRRPLRAAVGGAVFLGATAAALVALGEDATPGVAFLVLGAASLAGAGVAFARAGFPGGPRPTAREVLAAHWDYGRFSVAGAAVMWASGQVVLVLIPIVLGLAEAAAVAAVLNLYRPLHPVQQSVVNLALPGAASLAASGGEVRAYVRRALLPLAGGVLAYGALLTVVSGPLMHHLYAGRYDGYATVVLLVGCVYGASTVVQASTVVLKATGRVRAVPRVWAASAAFTTLTAVPAMLLLGVEGALAALAASYVLAAVVAARNVRGPKP